jgi:trehalose synthase-fused probable maltokinase
VTPPDRTPAPGVPITTAIAALPSDALLRYLERQRWYGSKGTKAGGAKVTNVVVLPWGDGRYAMARATVNAGGEQAYQLLLGLAPPDASIEPETAIVGRVRGADYDVTLYDAVHDAAFRDGLIAALRTGANASDGARGEWVAEPVSPSAASGDAASTVGKAEQSNTSIVAGDMIVKLFRTLKSGVHPDAEVTRFLTTRADFENTPPLLATMRLEMVDAAVTGGRDQSVTTGMAQRFLPGSTDAWAYTLERGKAYFNAPATREPQNAFVADAGQLGAVTRAMHEALASDDDDAAFAPEHAEPEDLERWVARVERTIDEALSLLQRQVSSNAFPKANVGEAEALLRRRDHYVGWVNEIADTLGDDLGLRTRTHGDYHLGQVLRTKTGDFMIIDFEGEPSKPLEERREKTSPLRDVAGMLRSIAYAAATLGNSMPGSMDRATREVRTARWERDVRAAFLEGYLGAQDEDAAEILPEDSTHVRQLITLFETEKAFYELSYELNNRPTWAAIPMRGIGKLFVVGS